MNECTKNEGKFALKMLEEVAAQFSGAEGVDYFIKHVLTKSERVSIGRRIAVAKMILAGKTYFEIYEALRISPNTFRNIRKWIHEELPGYNDVLEENKKLEEAKKVERQKRFYDKVSPLSFENLKRRYPGHFLLFNLADEFLSSSQRRRSIKKLK